MSCRAWLTLLLAMVAAGPVAAQRIRSRPILQLAAPSNVTVQQTNGAVTISWLGVSGAVYRVTRAPDAASAGTAVAPPSAATTLTDPAAQPGTTIYYQVVAIYQNGTEAAAAPVGFSVPAQLAVPLGSIKTTTLATRMVNRGPAVGVTGTMAAANVSWSGVAGAVGYAVNRLDPGSSAWNTLSQGLQVAQFLDQPNGGFYRSGTYQYEVVADLGAGSTVTGRASWTRPEPTCVTPQGGSPLNLLDPTSSAFSFSVVGPYPNGAVLRWSQPKNSGVVAYRIDRAPAGSNTWAEAASTCGAAPSIPYVSAGNYQHVDQIVGVVPGGTYQYRLTAFAATGDYGSNIVSWTAPNEGTLQWLAPSVSGSTVTLRWRYDPPATNPPLPPVGYRVQTPDGAWRLAASGSCATVSGCSYTASGVASGQRQFALEAGWGSAPSGTTGWVVRNAATRTITTTIAVP